jgi:ParB family transcriptional regulator, chromosome partitioning protein
VILREVIMRSFVRKPASWAKRGPNARSYLGDESELRALAHSYLKRPLHPLICNPDGTLYDGNRRHMGLELIERLDVEVDICITDEALLADQVQEIQLVSAIHRADLSAYDKAVAMRDIKAARKGLTNKQLAEDVLDIDPSLVTRYLSLFECIAEVQDAARAGKLGVSDWYSVAKLPPDEQPVLLEMKLSGASRDQLERQGRKRRSNGQPVARASKIKCQLSSGVNVVVSGDEISLDEMIDALAEAGKEARKARDQGLDARTFQHVMRDRARAGS